MIQMRSLGLLICKVLACVGVSVLPFVCLYGFYYEFNLLFSYSLLGCVSLVFICLLLTFE